MNYCHFGVIGYVLRKFGYEMAPLLLALVLDDRWRELSSGAHDVGRQLHNFLHYPSIYVATSVVGLLLLSWAVAWSFGYRKSFADHAEQA